MSSKITRSGCPPSAQLHSATDLEISVGQAMLDLQGSSSSSSSGGSAGNDLKNDLKLLHVSSAEEVDVLGGKKAILIRVPVPELKLYQIVQQRLTRELEKKFSDRHVLFIAQRKMQKPSGKKTRSKQPRPRSRTLKEVHNSILSELVFPSEITAKRTVYHVDGSTTMKVTLDAKDSNALEYKLDSFASVYKKVTGKNVVFSFPPARATEA